MAILPLDKQTSDRVWIDVEGPFGETEKALLYETSAGRLWFPRSQLGARKKNAEGGHVRIEITRWVAQEKGLVKISR